MKITATEIRSTNTNSFRSGQWAKLLDGLPTRYGRLCYQVEFNNGVCDYWLVDDDQAKYEFRGRPDGLD